MIDALHETLASALVTHARCTCVDRIHWPWKRDETCVRCLALTQYDLRKAAHEIAVKEKL